MLKKRENIFIASDRKEKNLLNLLTAYENISEKQQIPALRLVGKIHPLEQKNIIHIGESKIEPYLKKSTFLLHPATFDPSPNVIVEAMAAGVIPVVSKKCGNYEWVERIDKRLIFEGTDVYHIEKKLVEIQRFSDATIRSLSAKAKKMSKEFDRKKGIETFRKSFLSLL